MKIQKKTVGGFNQRRGAVGVCGPWGRPILPEMLGPDNPPPLDRHRQF